MLLQKILICRCKGFMLPNNVKLFKNKIMIIKLIIKKLRGCLHEILSRARWNIFISVSGQLLRTAYMMQPEMRLISLRLAGVYIRPETKFTQNEISIHHKKNYVYITFHFGRNETNFFLEWPKINGPLSKNQSFLFTHVQMFPFICFHFG